MERVRCGATAVENFLAQWLRQVEPGAFTTQILRYFAGQLTDAQLIDAAPDNRSLIVTHTFIGLFQMLTNRHQDALPHFRWVRNNGDKDTIEYLLALGELERDSGAPVVLPPALGKTAPKPGEVRKSPSGIELVWIPPGEFMMGAANERRDERPVRRVTISEGFWMGRYEVTQLQWFTEMGTNPSNFDKCGSNCPVEKVSWEDAKGRFERLNAMNDGSSYSLPTEAEWEYAARAGSTGKYADDVGSMAWHRGNSGGITRPVGTKQPNAWGLYDMHGNVWEWCEDWYGDYHASNLIDSKGTSRGNRRILRGGAWIDGPGDARSSFRGKRSPTERFKSFGLRVVARERK